MNWVPFIAIFAGLLLGYFLAKLDVKLLNSSKNSYGGFSGTDPIIAQSEQRLYDLKYFLEYCKVRDVEELKKEIWKCRHPGKPYIQVPTDMRFTLGIYMIYDEATAKYKGDTVAKLEEEYQSKLRTTHATSNSDSRGLSPSQESL